MNRRAVEQREPETAMAARHMHFVRSSPADDPPVAVGLSPRDRLIAQAAYSLAEARGFVPGHEIEDWLAAEREVDSHFAGQARRR